MASLDIFKKHLNAHIYIYACIQKTCILKAGDRVSANILDFVRKKLGILANFVTKCAKS